MEQPEPFLAAVVQISPELFNKKGTLEKVRHWALEASKNEAKLILFPEVIIPGYPRGLIFGTRVGGRSQAGRDLFLRYWEHSMAVPGAETEYLAETARMAKSWIVIGVTEKDQISDTLYCSLLYFSPDGKLRHKHRKMKPTAAERILWGEGEGSDLNVLNTELGRIGGLICWENYMPLARTALYQQGLEIYLAPTADCRNTWQSTIEHIACESRAYVLGCNQLLKPEHYPEDLRLLLDQEFSPSTGGSAIISPLGKTLAGPLYDQEGVLIAEIDHKEIIRAKMDFDPIGHYARNDLFNFKWNSGASQEK